MAPRNIKPGVYAPVLTFFKAGSQDIDLETFKKHVVYMGERGVGPVVCGSMGEAPMLSEDERLQLVRSARSALDNAGLELPLIVGTGLSSTRGTIDLSRKVAAAGADIVIVIPSGYYASLMTRAALKKFFLEVSQASPIPVLTYNFPNAAGGVDMDSELLEEIARDCPNVCGAKLTCSQIGKVTRLAGVVSQPAFAELYPRSWRRNDDQPPFVVLGGFADFLLPSLIAQAHGAIAGMGNFAPRTLRRLYDVAQEALKTGDIGLLGDAQKLQAMVSQADFPTSWVHIPGAKRLLEDLRGYGGLPREPLRPVDEEAYQKMMRNPAVIQLLELEKSLEAGGEEDALSEQIVPSNLVSHLQTTIRWA
ncbi:hypothetical protein BCR39DRAFT_591561 [Naematelia encephala]|uniref:Dihydrodipicolinate synthase n=1 Tax=Naematelia encephala TaxID=71784 RepID=A0A1Y2AGV9_9TREE|nr:hypothetical protein BCR39DRAFT_591561 [Naematelia encephala]